MAAALLACGLMFYGSASASPAAPPQGGKALGLIHQSGGATSGPRSARVKLDGLPVDPTLPVTNHGGPLMHSQKVYFIFWAPPGYSFPAGYVSGVQKFAQDVAADSGKTSNAYGAIQQYGVNNVFSYGGSVMDSDTFPATGSSNCPVGPGNVCLTDQDLLDEIAQVQFGNGWTGGFVNQFALVLPPNVDTCIGSTTDDGCSYFVSPDNSGFCAYHSWYEYEHSSTPYIYLNLPYEVQQASGCHTTDGSTVQPEPNGDVDVVLSPLSHEEREAATDPVGTGWYDSAGNEADDKCYIHYGSQLGNNGTDDYNQLINGDGYENQNEWSNKLKGCYQVGPPTIASLSATSGLAGSTIGITGTNFFAQEGSTPTVSFNGIASPTVLVDSPTHLTVTVPAGVHTGKVTVQAVGGTVTSTQSFGPTPTVSSFTDTLSNPDADDVTGTKIVVHGSAFVGVTSVKFNGVAAAFSLVAVDGTSLQAVVPATATTGPVTVTTSAGGTSAGLTFTIKPKITSFTPLKAPGLSNVTITGTGLAAATEVDFSGDASPHIVSDTATKIVAQVPSDATPGQITVKNAVPDIGTSAGSFTPTPAISGLSVLDGSAGDTVHITGAILGGITSVKFGTFASGTVSNVTATGLDATVPGAPFSTGKVTVSTAGGATAVSTQTFAITKVTAITPTKAAAGATITITGQGLGDAQTVDFPNATGVVPVRTATSLKVVVPGDAVDGPLTVNMPDSGMPTTPVFKPLPRITSVDDPTYQAGGTVTVTGTNLQIAGPSTAKLGSVSVTSTLTAITPTSFQFVVPANGLTGAVSFTDAAGSTTSAVNLVKVVPTISGPPAPNESTVGSHITITGATFTGTTSVRFGADTHKAPFVVGGGGTTLNVTIPATAISGKISITNAGGTTQTALPFKLDPVVTSFTPTSGPTGTQITVKGTGFTGADDVSWPGGDAVPTNVTATSLTVIVPPGSASGGIQVFTSVGGADANSEPSNTAFTVTLSVTAVTPAFADYGDTVEISGVGFTGATEVDFGTVAGTNLDVTSDSTLTVQVPASGDINHPITVKKGSVTAQSSGNFKLLGITSLSTTSALYGVDVNINGNGFTGATHVKFGGTAASFVVDSDTEITAAVPDGSSAGTISVTVPGPYTTTSADTFTPQSLAGVVVNEVGTGSGTSFVELYNGTNSTVTIGDGARIAFLQPSGTVEVALYTPGAPGVSIPAHSFYLLSTDPLPSAGGGIALEYPDRTIVDSVGWGTATNAFVEGSAAPASADGQSIGRTTDGTDTNDNSADFSEFTTPTPGATNG